MRLLPIRGLAIRTLAIRIMALTVMLLAAWPAAAQLTREELALRNQIYELQQQVQTLQQQAANQGGGGSYLGRPGYPPPPTGSSSDIVAQLLARVQTLEEEMRTLRGRVDEVQNQLQQQSADLAKRIDDLKFQMQNGQPGGPPTGATPPAGPTTGTFQMPITPGYPNQGYANQGYPAQGQSSPGPVSLQPNPLLSPPPGPLGTAQVPPAPQAAPPVRRTPELAIQDGNAALARHDYTAAEAAAHEVLNNFRTSPRAYRCTVPFWHRHSRGNANFRRRRLPTMIRTIATGRAPARRRRWWGWLIR